MAEGTQTARRAVADRTRGAADLKYYTFISQVETGYGRVPTESMQAWAEALGVKPNEFARRPTDDPQFFLLEPAPECECIPSISRLGRRYIVEDGNGGAIGESAISTRW